MESSAYVDPDVNALLASADPEAKDFWELTPEEARAASDSMIDGMLGPVPLDEVRDILIPSENGGIPARLYRADASTSGPLLVFFHGGGWEIGSIEFADRPIRRLVHDSRVSVLSIEYRLTPEHPFPAGFDDCYDATVWARDNLAELGGDGSFFGVGGDSSGGNLAAAVAQRSRNEGGPSIDHQLLIYPVVTRDFDTHSYRQFASGYFLTRETMRSFWELYVGKDPAPRYADLLVEEDLAGLPSASVITAGLDPLQDEGALYARRLAEAGVEVTFTHVHGLIHGIWTMDSVGERAYRFGLDIAGALVRATATMSDVGALLLQRQR